MTTMTFDHQGDHSGSVQQVMGTYRDAAAVYQAIIDCDIAGLKTVRENAPCPACLLASVALVGLHLVCGGTGVAPGLDGRPVFSEYWEAELRRRLGMIRAEARRGLSRGEATDG